MPNPVEKSGVHITGEDSGWPVGNQDTDLEPPHTKDGSGTDDGDYPQAIGVADGEIRDDEGVNEVQVVTITGSPTGGTFTLTYAGQTTSAIAYDAAASAVDAALEALSNIGAGDVAVTGSAGGPYTVTFGGALAETNVAQMTASGASLTGGTSPAVAVTTSTPGEAV